MTTDDSPAEFEKQLERYLRAVADRRGVPGIALQIVARGHVAKAAVGFSSSAAERPMSTRTLLSAGHTFHLCMALTAARLQIEGRLDLHDRIGRLIPELAGSEVGDRVRVRHLLSHTGGYTSFSLGDPAIRKKYSRSSLIEELRRSSIWFEPGTVYSYSPTVAPLLVEILRGAGADMSGADTARHSLVGADSWLSAIQTSAASIADAHAIRQGKVLSSKLDFARLYCDFWRASGLATVVSIEQLSTLLWEHLRGAFMDLLLKPLTTVPDAAGDPKAEQQPAAVGLGVYQYANGWYGCNGPASGHWCSVRFSRSHQAAIVLGMNMHSPPVAEQIMDSVIVSLTGAAPRANRECELGRWAADELVGAYTGLTGGMVRITAGRAVLYCDVRSARNGRLERIVLGKNRSGNWVVRDWAPNIRLAVFRDPARPEPCLMINDKAYRKGSASTADA